MDDFFAATPTAPAATPWGAPAPTAGRPAQAPAGLTLPAIGLGVGGLMLVVGSLLPWVSVLTVGVSGIDLRHGVVALVAGVVALVAAAAVATGGVVGGARAGVLHVAALAVGLAALLSAVYVWARLRAVVSDLDALAGLGAGSLSDEVAQDLPAGADPFAQGFAELGQQLMDAFTPQPAAGLWLVLVASAVVVVSAGAALRTKG